MNRAPLPVFIGFDHNEAVAYHVLAHSIMRRASRPVAITPLYQPALRRMRAYTRAPSAAESTEFSMTRFLTPWLSGFARVSIFLDCDMLCLGDIAELEAFALSDPYSDVAVVQHDYVSRAKTKFLHQANAAYPRKNWSSVMVFNGHRARTRDLTPEFVGAAAPADLHRFGWARDLGALPPEWNHLVGEYAPRQDAKLVHFTLGGPWFADYATCEYADAWRAEREAAHHVNLTGVPHGQAQTQEDAAARAAAPAAAAALPPLLAKAPRRGNVP